MEDLDGGLADVDGDRTTAPVFEGGRGGRTSSAHGGYCGETADPMMGQLPPECVRESVEEEHPRGDSATRTADRIIGAAE